MLRFSQLNLAMLLAMLLLAGTLLALVISNCGPDRRAYVDRNRDILRSLPEPPGVERLSVEDNPYFRERGPFLSNVPVGWTTNAVYRAPGSMTANDVIDFYLENMGGEWEARVDETPIVDLASGRRVGTERTVLFTNGTAIVNVMPDNMYGGGPHTYELAIDHRFK